MDDLLRTGHTSCLVITISRVLLDAFIPLLLCVCGFGVCVVFWFVLLVFCWGFRFFVSAFFSCGMTSYGSAPRVHEAATVSASLAVINTASKHLHNDLARAIEALEQKKSECY